MVVTVTTTADVAQVLATALDDIDGLRVYTYVADNFRPDGIIIAQPNIDWVDNQSGFCAATWQFPCQLIVARNSDREAQNELARLVSEVGLALSQDPPDGVFSLEPQNARPITVTVAGTDLPAYLINVLIRA